jgi:hypothetical protein
MLAMPKENHDLAARPSQRLAVQLADMIPGAVAISVSLVDPRHQWPHPYAVAFDVRGARLPLGRITAKIAARWVLRTWPDADWTCLHTLDLVTGQFAVGPAAALRGR